MRTLALGGEGTWATSDAYKRTGDTFGMSGGVGNAGYMTNASGPQHNVEQFFLRSNGGGISWGDQIYGSEANATLFIRLLHGEGPGTDASFRNFNSENHGYDTLYRGWVGTMRRYIPTYLKQQTAGGK